MKRITPATVTIGVFAIVCGLVATYIVRHVLTAEPEVARPTPGIPVVVAKVNIPKHARLRLEDLEVIRVPAGQKIPDGVLHKAEVAADRVIKTAVTAGQALHADMLFGIGEKLPGLAEQIPAGMRALTLSVPAADVKFVDAGSRVDIAMTVTGDHPDLGQVSTRTLLREVPVVEISRLRARRAAEPSETTLTVAVTPKDANKLINAQRSGSLSVTLCSAAGSAGGNQADSITRRELLGLRDIPPIVPYTVEKWEGSRMHVVELTSRQVQESRQTAAGETDSNEVQSVSHEAPAAPVKPDFSVVRPRIVLPPEVVSARGR